MYTNLYKKNLYKICNIIMKELYSNLQKKIKRYRFVENKCLIQSCANVYTNLFKIIDLCTRFVSNL